MWVTREALQRHLCCVGPGAGPGTAQSNRASASLQSTCGTALGIQSPPNDINLDTVSESTVF